MSTDFVCIPDLHFGFAGNIFPELNDPDAVLLEAIEPVITYARENAVDHLIFLGDIFEDPDPSQDQINKFLQLLRTLSAKFRIDLIPGNHDYSFVGRNSLETINFVTSVFGIDNVFLHMRPERAVINGVPFCFMPWPYYDKEKAKLKLTPSVNIAHVAQHGAIADNGSKVKQGGVKLNTDEDFWVIGHLHRRQSSRHVFYPGTLYQKSFGENLPKGIAHYTATYKNGTLKLKEKWHPIVPPYELHNIRVQTPEDLKLVLPQKEKRPILRYKLFIKNNVALPPNFLTDNPHVIKHEGWRSSSELEELERGSISIVQLPPMELDQIVYSDLSPMLKQYGLKKAERVKGKRIIETIVAKITAQG